MAVEMAKRGVIKKDLDSQEFMPNSMLHYANWRMKVKSLSRVQLFATLWTVAHQAPPSMGFSRQEYWSRLPFPSPGDLPDPGTEPRSPTLQADALTSEQPGKPQTIPKTKNSDIIIVQCNVSFEFPEQFFNIISLKKATSFNFL